MNDVEKRMVLDQAAEWYVRRDAGSLSAVEQSKFENWLSEPSHRRAFEEIEATWSDLAFIPHPGRTPRAVPVPAPHAAFVRQAMAAAAALIAAISIGYVFDLPVRLQADGYTGAGETKTMTLEDGSSIVLNTKTAIALDYTHDARRVRLLRGEAAFTVARDISRPFLVDTAGGEARALGTAFVVRNSGSETSVTVLESRVRVSYPIGARTSVQLSAGEAVEYSPRGVGEVRPIDAETETAWRRGKLIFVDKPLGSVIAELNRYHSGRIQITNGSISGHLVSGVFELSDPVRVLDALESSLGIHSTRLTNYLILLHR